MVLLTVAMALTMVFANGSTESRGSLVIYSPNSDTLTNAAYVFGDKYGIDITILSMGTGECLQ